ncbi:MULTISPECIES: hypothetical protein [Kordiimonas]|jgi:phosphoglycerol transferase MdoB-like AlkP superfamily enzyme|uniref:hypothetical protein n=1 Tax=Kordiimonas TaxID=288021 RepID=UPI00257995E6|nr:hypothetical protein [Kordiimonas sp. UBA4487]
MGYDKGTLISPDRQLLICMLDVLLWYVLFVVMKWIGMTAPLETPFHDLIKLVFSLAGHFGYWLLPIFWGQRRTPMMIAFGIRQANKTGAAGGVTIHILRALIYPLILMIAVPTLFIRRSNRYDPVFGYTMIQETTG